MDIPSFDALLQGAQQGVHAFARASDAYAQGFAPSSVALWALLIAAGVVLLEWLLGRRTHPRS